MATLAYGTVGSNDLEAARNFYDALFASIGVASLFDHPSGGRVYGRDGRILFGVLGTFDGLPATVGNGTMLAFHFDRPEEVQAFHARALELGGTDEGAPGFRGASPFYMAYFRDLDGNKLCGFHQTGPV